MSRGNSTTYRRTSVVGKSMIITDTDKPIEIIRASFLKDYILGVFPVDKGYPFYPGVRYGLIKNNDIKYINSWKDMEDKVNLKLNNVLSFARLRTSYEIFFSKPLLFSEHYLEIMARENLKYDPSFGESRRKNFKDFLKIHPTIVSFKEITPKYRKFPVVLKINKNFRVARVIVNEKGDFYILFEDFSDNGAVISEKRILITDKAVSREIRMPWHR